MKTRFARLPLTLLAGLAGLVLAAGCEVDDDDYDHTPPPGQGSLIIDNFTPYDLDLFVNGIRLGEVDSDDDRTFDLKPGVYRVVLDADDSDADWSDDVDVLSGKLTILKVRASYNNLDVDREIE